MDPLATAADLKLHLQRDVPDALADLALAGASGAVRAYCRWGISRATETFHIMGDGSAFITLPTLYLNEVLEVRVDGVAIDPAAIPYPIWSQQGQIYYGALWGLNTKIQVDVEHGFLPVPDLVRLVTLTLAARTVNNPEGLKRATTGSVTREWGTDLTDLHMRLLDQYRI